tara:strand:+ start:136 stop:744 length:609 start_codon:yes stop_codon:yes gene_type:complete
LVALYFIAHHRQIGQAKLGNATAREGEKTDSEVDIERRDTITNAAIQDETSLEEESKTYDTPIPILNMSHGDEEIFMKESSGDESSGESRDVREIAALLSTTEDGGGVGDGKTEEDEVFMVESSGDEEEEVHTTNHKAHRSRTVRRKERDQSDGRNERQSISIGGVFVGEVEVTGDGAGEHGESGQWLHDSVQRVCVSFRHK